MSAAPDMKTEFVLSGRRKRHQPRPAIPLKWPQGSTNDVKKRRYELFDAWHDVAMQVLEIAREDFRLIAAVSRVFMFTSGEITASNREFAWHAGCCSDKTITRYVQRYSDLGIFIVSTGWKAGRNQLLQTRTIRLALPVQLDEKIKLPDGVTFDFDTRGLGDRDTRGPADGGGYRTDTRGPGDEPHRRDTRGLEGRDTRGPGIATDTTEGGREKGLGSFDAEPPSEPEAI